MKLQTKCRTSGSYGWNFRQSARNVASMDEASDKVLEIWLRWKKLQTMDVASYQVPDLAPMDESSDKVPDIWLLWRKLQTKCQKCGFNGWSFGQSAWDLAPMEKASDNGCNFLSGARSGSNRWSFRQSAGHLAPMDEASDKVLEIWLQWIKLQKKCWRSGSNWWSFRQSARNPFPMDEALDKVTEI